MRPRLQHAKTHGDHSCVPPGLFGKPYSIGKYGVSGAYSSPWRRECQSILMKDQTFSRLMNENQPFKLRRISGFASDAAAASCGRGASRRREKSAHFGRALVDYVALMLVDGNVELKMLRSAAFLSVPAP